MVKEGRESWVKTKKNYSKGLGLGILGRGSQISSHLGLKSCVLLWGFLQPFKLIPAKYSRFMFWCIPKLKLLFYVNRNIFQCGSCSQWPICFGWALSRVRQTFVTVSILKFLVGSRNSSNGWSKRASHNEGSKVLTHTHTHTHMHKK